MPKNSLIDKSYTTRHTVNHRVVTSLLRLMVDDKSGHLDAARNLYTFIQEVDKKTGKVTMFKILL